MVSILESEYRKGQLAFMKGIEVLQALIVLLCMTSQALGRVGIHELMYHPVSLNEGDEYIELFNSGPDAADLSGWRLTDAVQYTFPAGTILAAHAFLVISPDRSAFLSRYGEVPVLGPYANHLGNAGETCTLLDAAGRLVDQVTYRDECGWPVAADGLGASLEKLHPAMPSSFPQSWAAGPVHGTPGAPNATARSLPFPVVDALAQTPVLPSATEPVVMAIAIHSAEPVQTVTLFYKAEAEPSFASVLMDDEGLEPDASAGDGIFTATIPAFPRGSIVEFFVEAVDLAGSAGYWPVPQRLETAFYRVEDQQPPENGIPLYRVVMRTQDETELWTRNPNSDVLLPATFIYNQDIYHNVGIRFRGKGSRHADPHSYRVDFSSTRYFGSIRKLNLNGHNVSRQYIGMKAFQRLGLPAPEVQLVSLLFNDAYTPAYLQVERCDRDMMNRVFHDPSGNLYRGIERANFDYLGPEKSAYKPYYTKINNELEDDYADIIALCDAFSNLPEDRFALEIGSQIALEQWIRWFALKQVLNDLEGGLSKERGDDYFIYHNPGDTLFYLLPWDQDSILSEGFLPPHHHGVLSVQRLLRHPDLARFYFQVIIDIIDQDLSPAIMAQMIEQTAPVTTPQHRAQLLDIYTRLCAYNRGMIPQALTLDSSDPSSFDAQVISQRDQWLFFRGRTEPAGEPLAWTQIQYDDSAWETGRGGFGYGDGDDQTVLNDMEDQYTTVFLRRSFDVPPDTEVASLSLSVLVDDGFVAYLNGQEVARMHIQGPPDYLTTAYSSAEANNQYLVFSIDPALLGTGKNTLALVGANVDLDSSDFSLDASLWAHIDGGAQIVLQGQADVLHTRYVQVNGQDVVFEPWSGQWHYPTLLQDGGNRYIIQALDAWHQVVDVTQTVVYKAGQKPTDGEEIVGEITWTAKESPYVFDRNMIVAASDTLRIESGVHIYFPQDAGLIVYGTLTVEGATDAPVTFAPAPGHSRWGGIAIDHGAAAVQIHNASFSAAEGFTFRTVSYPATVSVQSSTVSIDYCWFDGQSSKGVDAAGSVLSVRNSTFMAMEESVHCNRCSTIIEDNRFLYLHGYHDAIDFDGEKPPRSIIRGNIIHGSEDDGIDLGDASPWIDRNFIIACANKGISMEGVSQPLLTNNLIQQSFQGIAIKNRCNATVIHNTIVDCDQGIALFEKPTTGSGGGQATVINTIIWDCQESLSLDALSTISVRSSNLMHLAGVEDPSNFSLDPKWEVSAAGILIPALGSPLIDRGQPSEIMVDYFGTTRPFGPLPDIGAVEREYDVSIFDWFHYGLRE
ncbi:MAG: CotH kinase family protein [bacterium]|nr:CotH kinase family protein [bacterium]